MENDKIVLFVNQKLFRIWYLDNEGTKDTAIRELIADGKVEWQGHLEGCGFLPLELIMNFDEVREKLDLSDDEKNNEEVKEPGSRFILRFVEDGYLTKEQREKIVDVLVKSDVDSIEWYKERVQYEICKIGLIGYDKLSDKELIDAYADYVDGHEIQYDKRVYPIVFDWDEGIAQCILCGELFKIGDTGNELGFCVKCQEKPDFPYDLDAYYKDYDAGEIVFKGVDSMSRGLLERYRK